MSNYDFMIKKEYPNLESFVKFYMLDEEQCQEVLKIDSSGFDYGKVSSAGKEPYVDKRIRIVKAGGIRKEGNEWLYTRCGEKISSLNDKHFNVDIIGLFDNIMYLRYEADENDPDNHGKFDWHKDTGYGHHAMRKLSVTISLSDPSEYEGGDFIIFDSGEKNLGKLKMGEAIIFPSYMQHRVTPVTKGIRQALVVFVYGPRYK